MRLALIFLAGCFALFAWVVTPAVSQPTAQSAQSTDASSAAQSDAAERHARRTACLKEAKSKKLVGAQRTAFVKDCMSANSSRQAVLSPAVAVP